MLARFEVLNLRGKAAIELGGVPRGDGGNAALAGNQVGPGGGNVKAEPMPVMTIRRSLILGY